jgi:hypothetical protein
MNEDWSVRDREMGSTPKYRRMRMRREHDHQNLLSPMETRVEEGYLPLDVRSLSSPLEANDSEGRGEWGSQWDLLLPRRESGGVELLAWTQCVWLLSQSHDRDRHIERNIFLFVIDDDSEKKTKVAVAVRALTVRALTVRAVTVRAVAVWVLTAVIVTLHQGSLIGQAIGPMLELECGSRAALLSSQGWLSGLNPHQARQHAAQINQPRSWHTQVPHRHHLLAHPWDPPGLLPPSPHRVGWLSSVFERSQRHWERRWCEEWGLWSQEYHCSRVWEKRRRMKSKRPFASSLDSREENSSVLERRKKRWRKSHQRRSVELKEKKREEGHRQLEEEEDQGDWRSADDWFFSFVLC